MLMHAADNIVFPGLALPVSGGEHGAGGRGGGGTADLIFGQLLCSRLCHDLIGPTAAINAGEELIREGVDGEDARDLIADSARQLTARLSFFRALFSPGGSAAAGMSVREVRALVEGFLLGSRISLDWAAGGTDDQPLYGDAVRLLLGTAMLAADALPRGGVVRIRLRRRAGDIGLEVQASGPKERLEPGVLQALQCLDAGGVNARTIHAFHLSQLVRRTRGALSVDGGEGQPLRMVLQVPIERVSMAA